MGAVITTDLTPSPTSSSPAPPPSPRSHRPPSPSLRPPPPHSLPPITPATLAQPRRVPISSPEPADTRKNLEEVLKGAGMSLKNVVKANIYLSNLSRDFAAVNEVSDVAAV